MYSFFCKKQTIKPMIKVIAFFALVYASANWGKPRKKYRGTGINRWPRNW